MNSIAIVTLNDDNNYGNRLQNYALQKLLGKYGDVTTVEIRAGVSTCRAYFKSIFRHSKQRLINVFNLIKGGRRAAIARRAFANMDFTNKYVKHNIYTYTTFSGLHGKFGAKPSVVVLGSDQIWNPVVESYDELLFRLGAFMPEGINVISYAASFGVAQVDGQIRRLYHDSLPKISAISVREERGNELVHELAGVNSTVVLDPTLMLKANEWESITRNFVDNNDKYILTYFLGSASPEQNDVIEKYAREHKYRIRRLVDISDIETYVAGPQDFVELFAKAQYVFTDSYHACCFSILFNKQFTVFNRSNVAGKTNMNSRMETLFHLFNLRNSVQTTGLAPHIDYEEVNILLERYREHSRSWLDKAIQRY